MKPYYLEKFGNPGSTTHIYGEDAAKAVAQARKQVAQVINASQNEIIFTSGATESNNLAIQGVIKAIKKKRNKKVHIITSMIEHKSVLNIFVNLEKWGIDTTYINPDVKGLVPIDDIQKSIRDDTVLISFMYANNEIGTINPISEIGKIASDRGIYFHCDASQAFGKLPIDVKEMNVHLLSFSGHKIYGPKGIGALYVRKNFPKVEINEIVYGGAQEQGLRSGTLATPLIVGLAEASQLASSQMNDEGLRLLRLRSRFLEGLRVKCERVLINGCLEKRLPNNLNISFLGIESETLMMNLWNDIAISNGSACSSENWESSYVLKAMGLNKSRIDSALRISFGRFTTEEEVDFAIDCISDQVRQLDTKYVGPANV